MDGRGVGAGVKGREWMGMDKSAGGGGLVMHSCILNGDVLSFCKATCVHLYSL